MESLWGVMTVVGPILLGAIIVWAILRNRPQATPRSEAHTERATARNYDEIEREDDRDANKV